MKALNSLPMTIKDKEDFVNTIVDNCNKEGGGAAVSQYAPRYFKIDWDKADIGWRQLLAYFDSDNDKNVYKNLSFAASIKIQDEGYTIIASNIPSDYAAITAFSFIPLYVPSNIGLGIDRIKTIEDYIITTNFTLKNLMGIESNISMEGITEITEEEFYKIN